jgi:hypothetical protein
MGKACVLVIVSLVIAACQSMYGPKPEKLRTPGKLPVPAQTEQAIAGPAYVENCAVDFQKAPPKAGVKRDERAAAKLVETGDTTLSSADTTTDGSKRGDLMRATIDRYSDALARDPFNADATLKLALAYDRVYRKGCALALLRRLVALAGNRNFEPAAKADMNRVDDNKQWFKDYRDQALKAIGH